MVANWNHSIFDPLRTAGEYNQDYSNARDAYNNWSNSYSSMYNDPGAPRANTWGAQAVPGTRGQNSFNYGENPLVTGGDAGPRDSVSVGFGADMQTLPSYAAQSAAGFRAPSDPYSGINVPPPPVMPNEAALTENLRRLQYGQQVQQGNYNRMMGGGFAGGVLPDNMMQTYQSGGQFGADSRGIRPTNPFAQSPSYGPEQAMSASYGRQGGLGGLGGFGTTEVFNV